MGRNGRAWVEANAARDVLADRYLAILEDLHQQASVHTYPLAEPQKHATTKVTAKPDY